MPKKYTLQIVALLRPRLLLQFRWSILLSLQVHGNLTAGHGLLVELIITFQLVFTIFASCDSKRTDVTGSIALAIGFSVAIGHLFAVSFKSI